MLSGILYMFVFHFPKSAKFSSTYWNEFHFSKMKRFDVPSLFVIQSSVMFEIPQRCISHVTDGGSGKLKKMNWISLKNWADFFRWKDRWQTPPISLMTTLPRLELGGKQKRKGTFFAIGCSFAPIFISGGSLFSSCDVSMLRLQFSDIFLVCVYRTIIYIYIYSRAYVCFYLYEYFNAVNVMQE